MARDRWILMQDDFSPSKVEGRENTLILGLYDPRGDEGFTGLWLVRGGDTNEEILAKEHASKAAACVRGESYKPLVWRRPLYVGDPIRIGGAHGEVVVRRPSGICMKATGRYKSKLKDGKRLRIWVSFPMGALYQELVTPRLLGTAKVKFVFPPKKKVAA